jgi:hypothetical protein
MFLKRNYINIFKISLSFSPLSFELFVSIIVEIELKIKFYAIVLFKKVFIKRRRVNVQ